MNNTAITVSFPTDNSDASQLARLHTATVTLQNLLGPGEGCPSASTTFNQQAQAIQANAGTAPSAAPTPSPSPQSAISVPSVVPAPGPSVAPAPLASGSAPVNPTLVPQFGHTAGLDPTGTGNCAGITNSAGTVIEVPCSCPPNRNSFIQVKFQVILN